MFVSVIRCSVKLFIVALLFSSIPLKAQDIGNNFNIANVNDWGSGFIAIIEYEVQQPDTTGGVLEDWLIEIDYSGTAQFNNVWMSGYNAGIDSGYSGASGEYQISNVNQGYKPSLAPGFKLVFNLAGSGSGFNQDEFAFRFDNILSIAEPGTPNDTPVADNEITTTVVQL